MNFKSVTVFAVLGLALVACSEDETSGSDTATQESDLSGASAGTNGASGAKDDGAVPGKDERDLRIVCPLPPIAPLPKGDTKAAAIPCLSDAKEGGPRITWLCALPKPIDGAGPHDVGTAPVGAAPPHVPALLCIPAPAVDAKGHFDVKKDDHDVEKGDLATKKGLPPAVLCLPAIGGAPDVKDAPKDLPADAPKDLPVDGKPNVIALSCVPAPKLGDKPVGEPAAAH